MRKYIKAIKRRLNMPKELRNRVINDLESDIASRLEAGQTKEQIITEFGSPKQAAAELNQQMEAFTYKKNPWRWAFFILLLLSIFSFLFQGTLGTLMAVISFPINSSVGIIGGADGPTSILISAPANYFYQQIIISAILSLLGAAGFWMLSHIKRK